MIPVPTTTTAVTGYILIRILITFLRYALKLFAFSPLIVVGFFASTLCVKPSGNPFLLIGVIAVFAYALYLFIFFVKGILIAWKVQGKKKWILLFLTCISFTCLLPAAVAYPAVNKLVLQAGGNTSISVIFLTAIIYYLYTRYQFLTDMVPPASLGVYLAGIRVGMKHSRKKTAAPVVHHVLTPTPDPQLN